MKNLEWKTKKGIKQIGYDIVKKWKLDSSNFPKIWKMLYREDNLITTVNSEADLRGFLLMCDKEFSNDRIKTRTIMKGDNRHKIKNTDKVRYPLNQDQLDWFSTAIDLYEESISPDLPNIIEEPVIHLDKIRFNPYQPKPSNSLEPDKPKKRRWFPRRRVKIDWNFEKTYELINKRLTEINYELNRWKEAIGSDRNKDHKRVKNPNIGIGGRLYGDPKTLDLLDSYVKLPNYQIEYNPPDSFTIRILKDEDDKDDKSLNELIESLSQSVNLYNFKLNFIQNEKNLNLLKRFMDGLVDEKIKKIVDDGEDYLYIPHEDYRKFFEYNKELKRTVLKPYIQNILEHTIEYSIIEKDIPNEKLKYLRAFQETMDREMGYKQANEIPQWLVHTTSKDLA
jgi:hypothetical protein